MTGSAKQYWPHLVMTTLIAIWSASFVATKVAQREVSAAGLVALRFWLAVVCLLPFLRGNGLAALRAAALPGVFAGTALATGYLLQMYGMTETSASMGGLLAGLIVPLVAVGGFLFFHARLGTLSVSGLLLALVGIVLICMPSGDDKATGTGDSLRGILLQVGASISYAGHVLLLSKYGRSAPIAAFAFVQLTFVAAVGTVAALLDGGLPATPGRPIEWHTELVLAIAYLGVFATAVGIGVQSKVQHKVPSTHLALLFALQPLFAAVCGWAMLGEELSALQLLGGAGIVGGVVITSLDKQGR
ncbi:MAG: DMT family transporter [Planctomycetes bacterium]|nr:DMT family transporter [Planctomycetota bacterium]